MGTRREVVSAVPERYRSVKRAAASIHDGLGDVSTSSVCLSVKVQAPQRSPQGFSHGQHLSCHLHDGRLRPHD
jgi:hypothetical protein